MKNIVKRALRGVGLEVRRLPSYGLPWKKRLAKALEVFGYEIRALPTLAGLRPNDSSVEDSLLKQYADGGRIPHTPGYEEYRVQFIKSVISDSKYLTLFGSNRRLPEGYGFRLDERSVEYPWFFSRTSKRAKRFLDGGSAMNHEYVLSHAIWRERQVTILTLAPERKCFWDYGISYQFGDLRNLPFRDSWFDEIACLSTLEHVGMDASEFTHERVHREHNTKDFETALLEMKRVLKPGGGLLFTVPFGLRQDGGWFLQFDSALIERSAEIFEPARRDDTFFRYLPTGWQLAEAEDCADCSYSVWSADRSVYPPPDFAANARAVACCAWIKQ